MYIVTNMANGHQYVGVTRGSLEKRKYNHIWNAKSPQSKRSHLPLARAIRKYGEKLFAWNIYYDVEDYEAALDLEVSLITELKPKYNLTSGGEGAAGVVRTPEWREKIAVANRGKKRDPEAIARVAAKLRGRKRSAAAIAKLSAAMMGHPVSAIARAKIAARQRGRKMPLEHRAKLIAFHTGRKHSQEEIERRIAPLRGRKRPPEVGAKISAAKIGGRHSAETIEKIRKAKARLTPREIEEIRMLSETTTHKDIAMRYNMSRSAITQIINRRHYSHVRP